MYLTSDYSHVDVLAVLDIEISSYRSRPLVTNHGKHDENKDVRDDSQDGKEGQDSGGLLLGTSYVNINCSCFLANF